MSAAAHNQHTAHVDIETPSVVSLFVFDRDAGPERRRALNRILDVRELQPPPALPDGDPLTEPLIFTAPASVSPFTTLIASWNITPTAGVTAIIDARLHACDGSSSAWLTIGQVDVNAPLPPSFSPPHAPPTPMEKGGFARVDVDMVRSDRRCNGFEIRIRHEARIEARHNSSTSRKPPTLHRLAVCCGPSFRDERAQPFESQNASQRAPLEPSARLADVPFLSQHTDDPRLKGNACSPTSVAMVLNYYSVAVTQWQVAAQAFDAQHSIFGNWPSNIQSAWSNGVPGLVTRIRDFQQAEALVSLGVPIIASVRDPDGLIANAAYGKTVGHLLVIRGFDEDGNVLVNDPAGKSPTEGQLTYDRAAFARAWLGGGGVAYVLEPPRPQ